MTLKVIIEEEQGSESSPESSRSHNPYEETEGEARRREQSEQAIRNGSKVRLDSWIEEARQDVLPAAAKVSSLAGYVNLAYPIMKTLTKKKRGYYEEVEVKDKELWQKIDRAAANLERASETIDRINATIENARVPPRQAEHVRKLLLRKSTRIVENCELINLLTNMIKNTAKPPENELGESGQSKIYGSSVDLI